MNLPDNLLSEAWYLAAWAAWLPLFAFSLLRLDSRRFLDPVQSNLWFGMVVVLVLLWHLHAGVQPGLGLHFLGALVFVQCFGAAAAFIGLSLVLLGVLLNSNLGIFAFALNALFLVVLPVAFSLVWQRIIRGFLPPNFFVYIFIQSFFGALLSIVVVGVVLCVFLAIADVYPIDYLAEEYLPYFLLLGFAEAWISGMVLTLMVVYRPEWVASFQDARYLTDK